MDQLAGIAKGARKDSYRDRQDQAENSRQQSIDIPCIERLVCPLACHDAA
jgi:hypothetical protein